MKKTVRNADIYPPKLPELAFCGILLDKFHCVVVFVAVGVVFEFGLDFCVTAFAVAFSRTEGLDDAACFHNFFTGFVLVKLGNAFVNLVDFGFVFIRKLFLFFAVFIKAGFVHQIGLLWRAAFFFSFF